MPDDPDARPCVVCGAPTRHRWVRAGETVARCPPGQREACDRRARERVREAGDEHSD